MTPTRPTALTLLIRLLPMIAWMGLIFALSDRSTLPDTPGLTGEARSIAGHFTVYAGLAVLAWWALGLLELAPGKRLTIAFLIALAYGFSDEWHQSFVPGRDSSFFDIAVDAIGAIVGLSVLSWVLRVRAQGGSGDRAHS